MLPFSEEEAEYYGYDQELFSLNLSDTGQAQIAIRKWLLPQVDNWSAEGRELRREAARICISQGVAFSDFWLPGIDDRWKWTGDVEEHSRNLSLFQRQVWESLFGESYLAYSLDRYLLRIDRGFERYPDSPALWTPPVYSEWPSNFNGDGRSP